MTLGENLRRIRTGAGLTQGALSERAGVAQSQISEIESGKRTSTRFLPELARALKCSVEELDPRFIASNGSSGFEQVSSSRKDNGYSKGSIRVELDAFRTEVYATLRTLNASPTLARSRIDDLLAALREISESQTARVEDDSVHIFVETATSDGNNQDVDWSKK